MVGIIEHQQGITHSTLVEKLQQVKQENMNVYQQHAAAELQSKNIQQQHMVPESHQAPDIRVDEKDKGQKRHPRQKKEKQDTAEEAENTRESSGRMLDIIA
jgi:hypothetical protein